MIIIPKILLNKDLTFYHISTIYERESRFYVVKYFESITLVFNILNPSVHQSNYN